MGRVTGTPGSGLEARSTVADVTIRAATFADARRIAELSEVLGYPATAGERELLESGRRCEILGLVVDSTHRGRGVGRRLVQAAEAWALARGLDQMAVRSNVGRAESHPFYERLGYVRAKTQHAYRKRLPSLT
jgi:GNAT superfamily N-acetyltransferase